MVPQPIRNGLRPMRAHSVTFSMLACHGKGSILVITETQFAAIQGQVVNVTIN